jgi:hypothetical protein
VYPLKLRWEIQVEGDLYDGQVTLWSRQTGNNKNAARVSGDQDSRLTALSI